MYETELFDLLINEGAADAGFCSLEGYEYPYAVSIVYKLSRAVIKHINGKPTMPYFQHYRAVNAKLDQITLAAVRFIESKGYEAFPVAASQSTGEYSGYFAHKTAAVESGIGYIGRSALLVTPDFGPMVRLATVLTDMPLKRNREKLPFLCGDCTECVKACPAGAISGKQPTLCRDDFFDAEKCSHHMKTYKDIGRGAVCGLCMRACPKNKLQS